MSTETETEPTRAACPACGQITLEAAPTGWLPLTRLQCVAEDCDYEHTIEHR